jgi:hypothetical protein
MDKVENLLIKIFNILNSLNLLLDWRDPQKSLLIAKILTVSAVLHLFISFHYFLLALVLFLFLFFTPAWDMVLRAIKFPILFPLRMREISNLMNEGTNHASASSSNTEGSSKASSSLKEAGGVPPPPSSPRPGGGGGGGDHQNNNKAFFPPTSPSSSANGSAPRGFSRNGNGSGVPPAISSTHRGSISKGGGLISKLFQQHSDDGQSSPTAGASTFQQDPNDPNKVIEKVELKKDNVHPLLQPLLVPHSHLHEIKHRQNKEGLKSKRIGGIVYNPFAKKES